MTKQKLRLEINLDEIKNPHKNVLAAYRTAKAEDLYFKNIPENLNEAAIFTHSKTSNTPIRHLITHLYRKQASDGKEYCFFGEELFCKDYWGNEVQHFRTVGKHSLPIISKTYTLKPGRIVATSSIEEMQEKQEREVGISQMREVLEFPWTEIREQLIQWKEQGVISAETQLYIIIDNQRHSKPFTWDQWLNLDIQDLVLLNRAGPRYQSLLKGTELTPMVLAKLRERLQEDLLTELSKPNTK